MDLDLDSKHSTQNRERPQAEAAEPQSIDTPRKISRSHPPPLCSVCQQISFEKFLDSRYKDIDLGCLDHVLRCFDCPLCSYVRTVLQRGRDSYFDRAVTTWGMEPMAMSPPGISLESNNHFPAHRLSIWIKQGPKGEKRELQLLDVCKECPQLLDDKVVQPYRLSRVAVPATFDPELLMKWLAESPRIRQTRSSLTPLMDKHAFRLLDVAKSQVVAMRAPTRYLALSYVWGRSHTPYRPHIPDDQGLYVDDPWPVTIRALPRTIQDAIDLVRRINERYLWVDSLCINQADNVHKAAVIAEMGTIYSNAYLTIIAADGNNANAGLQRMHKQTISPALEVDVHFSYKSRPVSLMPARLHTMNIALERTAWNTRAWTYQERVLSPRIVAFTPNEVYYSSLSFDYREAYESEEIANRNHFDARQRTTETREERNMASVLWSPQVTDHPREWYIRVMKEVEAYSSRRLTYPGDRLDAFSGVISTFSSHLGISQQDQQALNGLFPLKYGFLQSLLWDSRDGSLAPSARVRQNCTGTRALPSWSWSGWVAAVRMSPSEKYAIRPTVMDHVNVRVDHDLYTWKRKPDIRETPPSPWWPFEPQSCQVDSRDACVLHLYTHVFHGEVRPVSTSLRLSVAPNLEEYSNFAYKCNVFFTLDTGSKILVGNTEVAGDYLNDDEPTSFEFVAMYRGSYKRYPIEKFLPNSPSSIKPAVFMMVQRWAQDKEFVERVALFQAFEESFKKRCGVTSVDELWNDLQEVMDDLSRRQHVKIV